MLNSTFVIPDFLTRKSKYPQEMFLEVPLNNGQEQRTRKAAPADHFNINLSVNKGHLCKTNNILLKKTYFFEQKIISRFSHL